MRVQQWMGNVSAAQRRQVEKRARRYGDTRRLSKKRASKDVGRDFDDYEVSKTTKRKRTPKNSFRVAFENVWL